MAFTQADRDTLASAIATGAVSVRYADGRQIEYQDARQMLEALAAIDAEIAGASSTATPRVAFATFLR
jgi:hypothetical protein